MPLAIPLVGTATAHAWPHVVALSRRAIISVLSRITTGQLIVTDVPSNITTVCGVLEPKQMNGADLKSKQKKKPAAPRAELKVLSESFWVRMVLFADMGFAESYMLGEVACEDLTSFFELFIHNKAALANGTTIFSSLSTLVSRLARSTNTLANARLHISAHYDISNDMFAAFLSSDMTYSCPIWQPKSTMSLRSAGEEKEEEEEEVEEEESLEHAQYTKLNYFISQAHIQPTDHVLEIGSGWGSFAIAAVKATGCRVTTLTLSQEQKALADERIAAAGLSDRIEVLLCDYRVLPAPPGGYFDKVVSIEMLEAVGAEFLKTYFERVDSLLKPEGGIAVFQCITIPETRYEAYAKGHDFIREYIFPGGHLPAVSQLVANIQEGSQGRLIVDDIKNIGGHYAKTLRKWGEKFQENFDSDIKPALLRDHKDMGDKDVEVFRRKWEYYFTYCEAGFRTKTLGDVIITVGREGATEMLHDIPL